MSETRSAEQRQLTNFAELLGELDAGTLQKRIEMALSDTALGVVTTGKTGKVTLTFTMKQVGESNQVNIDHKVDFSQPTHRGNRSEDHTTSSALYVGGRGALTILPNSNKELFAVPEKEEG